MTIEELVTIGVAHYRLGLYYDDFEELNRLSELCPDAEWKGRYKQKGLCNKALGLIAHDRVLNKQQLSPAFDK